MVGARRSRSPGRPPRDALGFYGYRVRDVMTRPVVTVPPEATLAQAAARMSRAGISGVPVVSKAGRLVGVLSMKDLLRILNQRAGLKMPGGVLELLLGGPGGAERTATYRRVLERVRVREAMSRPARSIGPEELIDDAVRYLVSARINRLPVVLRRKVVGIVTRTDLLGGLTGPGEPG